MTTTLASGLGRLMLTGCEGRGCGGGVGDGGTGGDFTGDIGCVFTNAANQG
jgi:hypothetical protein